MASWREMLLQHFKSGNTRLTVVSDPDGLLTEEGILAEIKDRGFDVIPLADPVAFRYVYESKCRAMWDQGKTPDLGVVLHSTQELESLPYDLLCAGRQLRFSLHRLLLASLHSAHLDALYEAYQQHQDAILGEKATKEFALTQCFHIVPSLITTSVDLLKVLLSRHAQNVPIPEPLDAYLLATLQTKKQFAVWPLADILSHRETFLRFLQDQWSVYLASLRGASKACIVPFDHQDIRAYADTLFLEGLLKPVSLDDVEALPSWVQIGIQHDPQASAVQRMRKLVERCAQTLPSEDASHREWQKLARTWAELVVLRWELDSCLEAQDRVSWGELQARIEQQFAIWMLHRFSSLHNLPCVPQPVMVHHVPRYLAAIRNEAHLEKIALIIVDGLALDQWLVLRRCIEAKHADWQLDETSVFAWVPTLTSVSRQSIFAAEPPLYFPDSFETTTKEPLHWSRFWEDQGSRIRRSP